MSARAIAAGDGALIGACVDTGHYIRSDEDPVEAIERFGKRTFGVHLKDVKTIEDGGNRRSRDRDHGLADRGRIRRLLESILGGDAPAVLAQLDETHALGIDPTSLIRGTQSARLYVTGQNLHVWTDYSGFDPEVSVSGQSNFSSGDAGTLPPNKVYTLRFDANF